MAGTIKLDGTTFLTKDSSNNFTLDVGSGGSISQGTFNGVVGSGATFNSTAWQSEIKSTAWYLNTSQTGAKDPLGATTSHWTLVDQSESSVPVLASSISVNDLISQTSGIWSFSMTGYYFLMWQFLIIANTSASLYNEVHMAVTNDNGSNYHTVNTVGQPCYTTGAQATQTGSIMLKITNTSNDKFKFMTGFQAGSTHLYTYGSSNPRHSNVRAIRLSGI